MTETATTTEIRLPRKLDEKLELLTASARITVRPASTGRFSNLAYTERKGRLHVFDAPDPEMDLPPYRTDGEDPENEDAWRRYNREERRIMRGYAEEGIAALGICGIQTEDVKLRFSRKAGCSCGCSPAFHVDSEALRGMDIFVHATR